jgi:hypothetical protein
MAAASRRGEGQQDFDGAHLSAGIHRRIRIYPCRGPGTGARGSQKAALREFRSGRIAHPGIVKVHDFKGRSLGRAPLRATPGAIRLDFLHEGHDLSVTCAAGATG